MARVLGNVTRKQGIRPHPLTAFTPSQRGPGLCTLRGQVEKAGDGGYVVDHMIPWPSGKEKEV